MRRLISESGTQIKHVERYPDLWQDMSGTTHTHQRLRDVVEMRDVRRTFEIWESLSHADLMRGLALKPGARQHVSGVIGGLNGNAIERQQTPQGEKWRVTNRAGIWRSWRLTPLPPEGIECARRRARQMADARHVS